MLELKKLKHGIEATFYNKEKALEMLGRHLGMFKDNVKIDGEMTVSNPFAGAYNRRTKKLFKQ